MTQHRSGRTYHDDSPWPHLELGPADDRRYLEQLVKAIFAAGLNWQVVDSHWAALGEVFHGCDPVRMAAMTERDIDQAAQNGAMRTTPGASMPTSSP
jgi:DNA-3-methyladenine glycosylase I